MVVCGGRDYRDRRRSEARLRKLPPGTVVIHGGSRGADRIAGEVARELGFEVVCYPAAWDRYGRVAGPVRNQAMLDCERPDLVIVFPGGRGTADMIRRATRAGVPLELCR